MRLPKLALAAVLALAALLALSSRPEGQERVFASPSRPRRRRPISR